MFNRGSYHGNATDKYTLDHKTKGGAKARQFTLHQLRKEPHHMSSYWVQLFQLRKTESLVQLLPFERARDAEATTPRDQKDTPPRLHRTEVYVGLPVLNDTYILKAKVNTSAQAKVLRVTPPPTPITKPLTILVSYNNQAILSRERTTLVVAYRNSTHSMPHYT